MTRMTMAMRAARAVLNDTTKTWRKQMRCVHSEAQNHGMTGNGSGTRTSVDDEEVGKFAAYGKRETGGESVSGWWDARPGTPTAALHSMNAARGRFTRDVLCEQFRYGSAHVYNLSIYMMMMTSEMNEQRERQCRVEITHTCMYVCIYICMYVYVCICMYVCVCVCVYRHDHVELGIVLYIYA